MEREVSELDRKLILKRNYLDKIYYYLNKDPIGQDELYIFVRKFFGEYLKLDYEFTYEELSQELNKAFIKPKVKERIDTFLLRLSESEYLEESTLGTTEINSYLMELNDIIKEIIHEDHSIIPEASIIKKVLNIGGTDNSISEINTLIDETIFHINKKNLEGAKKTYENILKLYETLSKSDKKTIVEKVTDIYEKLESMSKNKIVASSETMYIESKKSQEDDNSKLLKLITESETYIETDNINLAKSTYSEAIKIYEKFDSDSKKNFITKITSLYNSIQDFKPGKKKIAKSENKVIQTDIKEKTNTVVQTIPDTAINTQIPDILTIPPEIIIENKKAPVLENRIEKVEIKTEENTTPDVQTKIDANGNIIFAFGTQELQEAKIVDTPLKSAQSIIPQIKSENSLTSETNLSDISKTNIPKKSLENSKEVSLKSDSKIEETKSFDEEENKVLDFSNNIKERLNNLLDTNKATNLDISKETKIKNSEPKIVEPITTDKTSIETKKIESKLLDPKLNNITSKPIGETNPKTIVESNNYVLLNPISSPINTKSLDNQKIKSENKNNIEKKSDVKNIEKTSDINLEKISSLQKLLKRTDDDILIGKLDNAKKYYKEALLMYRKMNDKEKNESYNQFYSTFKKLDEALHKENLSKTIDEHLIHQKTVQRNISEKETNDDTEYIPKSLDILKITTLPVILDNDPDTTRVYELIEESYFNLSQNHKDVAMLKYYKALDTYRKLNFEDKKKTYPNLYQLFKKFS